MLEEVEGVVKKGVEQSRGGEELMCIRAAASRTEQNRAGQLETPILVNNGEERQRLSPAYRRLHSQYITQCPYARTQ